MPLIRDDETVRIDLPSSGEWVEVKARISRGDRVRIQQATFGQVKMRPGDATPELAVSELLEAAEFATLETVLKGWSFSEPLTPENIRRLDDESMDALKERLNELYDRPESEKKDSEPSGATSNSAADEPRSSLAG